MAANRKLLGEIQQVLKKVEEGVEIFDDIWGKVYAAEQQSLKEKFESELKKEIKKLQRLRDQIKTWIGSNDIKDKNQLLEARKTIENKMEMFKVCEKDTKTKAYSKEGLAREAKLDPKEALKDEKRAWLNDSLDKLNDHIDSVEAEREKLLAGKGSKNKNKEALERFENRIQKHKWHIAKLELILKLIENDELDPSSLDSVQDSVDYYIESAPDDDGAEGVENEFDIYEELGLDSLAASGISFDIAARSTTSTVKDDEAVTAPVKSSESVVEESQESTANASTTSDLTKKPIAGSKGKTELVASLLAKTSNPVTTQAATKTPVKAAPVPVSIAPAISKTATIPLAAKIAAKLNQEETTENANKSKISDTNLDSNSATEEYSSTIPAAVASVAAPSNLTNGMSWAHAAASVATNSTISSAGAGASLASLISSTNAAVNTPSSNTILSTNSMQPQIANNPNQSSAIKTINQISSVVETTGGHILNNANSVIQPTANATLPSNNLTPPPPPLQHQARINPEMMAILNQLKLSMSFAPDTLEHDRQSSLFNYTPRNFYGHSSHTFPTTPQFTNQNDIIALFEKLPMDTLFFVFYFQQGTYQQYLAAKQLKKHSWRFHKKYMTWFQRHEEPKIANEEYEEGTYVYFDYESGWCQRIKSEFKFEYAYLEDELGGSASDD